ncbi:MAG: hypothetical protein HYZ37_17210 [Candidatus Solibacter usitatus]|nr:hypothetical protein [Candidatus Solibacter usitatus]
MKESEPDTFTLGSRAPHRQLKKTGYGKFAIQEKDGSWNATKFADRCAGCHTTAVNAQTKAFTEFGIDCYACHGVVNLEHTNDTSLILLSKKNRTAPKTVASICGSCHLRGGKSKAMGVPYAYHYVAGDDLFSDYQAGNSSDGDRHVFRNVQDTLQNKSDVTCLNCHVVHAGSSQKHRRVLTSPACLDCHNETGPKKAVKPYSRANTACERE